MSGDELEKKLKKLMDSEEGRDVLFNVRAVTVSRCERRPLTTLNIHHSQLRQLEIL